MYRKKFIESLQCYSSSGRRACSNTKENTAQSKPVGFAQHLLTNLPHNLCAVLPKVSSSGIILHPAQELIRSSDGHTQIIFRWFAIH